MMIEVDKPIDEYSNNNADLRIKLCKAIEKIEEKNSQLNTILIKLDKNNLKIKNVTMIRLSLR